MERIRQNLGNKITVAALAMCLILCIAALAAGLGFYRSAVKDAMVETGMQLSEVLQAQLPAEDLVRYASDGEEDPASVQLQQLLRELTAANDLERAAVVCDHIRF